MQSEGVLPTGIVKSKVGGGVKRICAKRRGATNGKIVKSKVGGGWGKKDMCKAKGCYQRAL